jgi:F-type H+-transporting ATPase subunit delta
MGTSTVGLVGEAVALRWSSAWDLLDAIESAADDCLFAAAEQRGSLGEVEDELFRFDRVLSSEGELVGLLDDESVPAERRRSLVTALLADRVQPETLSLLGHALDTRRTPTITFAVDNLIEAAAARQQRSVARVESVRELTAAQQDRLEAALAQMYGRAISVRTAIDPAVQGGLVIRVGDEVIDGSIAAKLTQARAALAG